VLGLASGLAWLGGALLAHVVIFSLVRVERRARTLVGIFAAAGAGHLVTATLAGLDAWRAGYGLVLIGCGFLCYMPLYYTIAASQSVQMLIAVAASGELPVDELRRMYAVEQVFAGRLDTLVGAGYMARTAAGYAPTAKGRLVARVFCAVKAGWRLGPGG
jgi:hypothetical protein